MSISASVLYIGNLFGAPLIGYQSGVLGRKVSILTSVCLMFAGNLAIGLGTSFPVLLVGRILNGLACGGIMVIIAMYNCEISEPAVRAFASGLPIL